VPNVVFVAPYLLEATMRFVTATVHLPGVRVALIGSEPAASVPDQLATELTTYVRVDDCLDTGQLVDGIREAGRRLGPVDRLLGILEDLQVPLARTREILGITGMDATEAANFRDKSRMKDVLRAAGVPCARHGLARDADEAWTVAQHCGFPVVVKPPAGAGARGTFRAESAEQFGRWLAVSPPTAAEPVLVEEFMTGEEHSFDSVFVRGAMVWHSISRYTPTPLTVLEHPWIQWCVVLPRDIAGPEFEPIRAAAQDALRALGMYTGLSHMEWFRRADGSVAVSEVGARPPGAQFSTLLSFAHDVDMYAAWARLMVLDEFDPPARRWAVGAAYLRPQGHGRIRAVHGIDHLDPALHDLVVMARLPQPGEATSASYEGDGYVVVRHEKTDVVEEALGELITILQVEVE
jgi:biotin carboxylase